MTVRSGNFWRGLRHVRIADYSDSQKSFPFEVTPQPALTPALSPEERENRRPPVLLPFRKSFSEITIKRQSSAHMATPKPIARSNFKSQSLMRNID